MQRMAVLQRIVTIAFTVAIIAYPFAMYFGIQQLSTRTLGYGLLAVAALRLAVAIYAALFRARPLQISALLPAIALLLVAALAIVHGSKSTLYLYPILVNFSMLIIFALSLRWPPTIIERIARLQEPTLDDFGVRYTRRVTQIWCGFFLANGAISGWTAMLGNEKIWALYNGLISYLLMGLLLGGEWLVRQRVRGTAR